MIENLIYDVGMNNGDDTAYYLHRGYDVVAVEANPNLVIAAAQRFRREIGEGRLRIYETAIAAESGMLKFWINDEQPVLSSCHRASAEQCGSTSRAIDMRCTNFRSILDKEGTPFYLKIDIEGSDYLCIDALSGHELPR